MQKRLSLQDMARMADTSTATVSRVLSRRGDVKPELRERVLSVVRETGFVPNAHASAMAKKRFVRNGLVHRAIAMAVLGAKDGTFARLWDETYEGILAMAHEMDLGVTLCLVKQEELLAGNPPAALTRIPCDGILSSHPVGVDVSKLRNVAPTVLIGGAPTRDSGLPSVLADDYLGIASLMDYLCGLGHARFEFVTVGLSHLAYANRADAFRHQVERRGVRGQVAEPISERYDEYASAFARRDVRTRPTALLISSDGPAVALLHALLRVGVRAPQDVSVVGFDGRTWGKDSVPPLTSWHVDWREVGRRGVRTLTELVAGENVPSQILIGGNVVERESAGPPPAGTGG